MVVDDATGNGKILQRARDIDDRNSRRSCAFGLFLGIDGGQNAITWPTYQIEDTHPVGFQGSDVTPVELLVADVVENAFDQEFQVSAAWKCQSNVFGLCQSNRKSY